MTLGSEGFQETVSQTSQCSLGAVLLTGRKSHRVGGETMSWFQARLNLGKILNKTDSTFFRTTMRKSLVLRRHCSQSSFTAEQISLVEHQHFIFIFIKH